MKQKPHVPGSTRLTMRFGVEIEQRYQCAKCGVRYWATANIIAHLEAHLLFAWQVLWEQA